MADLLLLPIPTASVHDADPVADAVVTAHRARFNGHPACGPGDLGGVPGGDAALYRGVRRACARLGFIPIDADTLARAWQAQSERTGWFDPTAWPATPADFGLGAFPPGARGDAFPPCPSRLGLYAVLPDATWVARMAAAGVPTLQLRFKSTDPQAVAREVRSAVEAVRGSGSLLFINDHWQAAIQAGAYGVHLGQEDLDALASSEVQRLRDSGLRLGISTHGYAEMVRADRVSPSYLALGAVFPTTLKQMATAPQGLARLKAYARLMRGYPLVAIGGIDAERFPAVLDSGVGCVAVVRALVAAAEPEAEARRLMALIDAPRAE